MNTRPRWRELPAAMRARTERLLGGEVIAAVNCPGGFSPGFASRLILAEGRRAFVKAMDAEAWPGEETIYRDEARLAAVLPPDLPAPGFLGSFDDGRWVVVAFEDINGVEPAQPWQLDELDRVVAAIRPLATTTVSLPRDHPRLGGWSDIARDDVRRSRLRLVSPWAAEHLTQLIELDERGVAAARGESLVHFDLYPHNMLLTPERVVFVDWPHARLGAPIVDVVTVLAGAAATGLDPDPILRRHWPELDPVDVNAVLAAHAGFCMAGALGPTPPGLERIIAAKLDLALGFLTWLRRR